MMSTKVRYSIVIAASVAVLMLVHTGCSPTPGVRALMRRAAVFEEQGRSDKAVETYRAVIARAPQHAAAHLRLGYVEYLRGHIQEAEEAYLRAIDCDHRLITAYINLGVLYYHVGMVHKAQRTLEEALAIAPQSYDTMIALGHVYRELGDEKNAGAILDRAIAVEPAQPLAYYNKAVICADHKAWGDAVALIDIVLTKAPQFLDALELRALIAEAEGDTATARRYWYERAERGERNDHGTYRARERYEDLTQAK